MSSPIHSYLQSIAIHLQAGHATEHTHRPALQNLLTALLPNYRITNELRRIACGSPDFEIAKGEEPIGHIEAKDVGVNLEKVQHSEQLKRYLQSLNNLLLTDYLEFRWFVEGEYRPDLTVKLAVVDKKGKLTTTLEAFPRFESLLTAFVETPVVTLRSPEELAKKMAHLARLMNEVILRAYQQEEKTSKLHGQLESFRQVLIDTLTPEQFTDMLAQTICYGLFAAKCSMTPPSPPAPLPDGEGRQSFDSPLLLGERLGVKGFSRQTASHLVPKTNPFLRSLFNQIAGIELDDRLVWMVDHLVAVLNRADMAAILAKFGKRTRQEDPVVHFYETFLAHYDAKLRGVRGVYYTPEPVVSYIVRSIDGVLKETFGLKLGLADNSTLPPSLKERGKQGGFHPSPSGRGAGGEGKVHLHSPSGRGAGGEGKVYHAHLHGDRTLKYEYLMEHDFKTTIWTTLQPQSPFYLFMPQNVDLLAEYEAGWKMTEMMPVNSVGIVTGQDKETIAIDYENAKTLAQTHSLPETVIKPILYRPFDKNYVIYDEQVVTRPRFEVMQHLLLGENLGLALGRAGQVIGDKEWNIIFCSKTITDLNLYRRGGNNLFPLYLYPTEKTGLFASSKPNPTRKPNFSADFIQDLETRLNLQWISEGHGDFEKTISALDVFNYMYAVFHSSTYRQRYAEFLKIDFPRLPLTSDKMLFKPLVELGGQLVKIHLLEAEIENESSFPIQGSNLVEKLVYKNEQVYINTTQYFDHVTPEIWEFHIGGYQVGEKWLKDRKGRVLSFEDCSRYLYILAALEKTREVMGRIDEEIGKFPIQ